MNKIINDLIKIEIKTSADLASFKRRVSKKYKIPCPSNIQLLRAYHKLLRNKRGKSLEKIENEALLNSHTQLAVVRDLLKTRPIRSLSGIVNISVLTKPYPCPGKCLYCPIEKGIPKSYVSGEPAVERAKKLNYDPYLQVKKRIEMLKAEGHPTDKIELRIVGGTWSYYPKQYQLCFIKNCFKAANTETKTLHIKSPWQNNMSQLFEELMKEQGKNTKAKHRIVGLSIETRPDFIDEKEIKWLRELGVTMVELGVQSIYDDVLKLNRRGHGVEATIKATKLLKDAGFKVLYQMMPNLLGSNPKRDEKMFEELFSNPDFQPDYLKIYPCALLKEAPLYQWYKKRNYKPYSEKELIDLLTKIKKRIPYYVRIQRITRDIPSDRVIAGGAKISNLRQILLEKMKKDYNPPTTLPQERAPSWQCKCIRCREVRENYNPKEKIYLFRQDYQASRGKEIFLSYENKNRTKLYSLLRLRIPSQYYQPRTHNTTPVLKEVAIIREVHTYGELVPISEIKIAPQHRGLGKKLIKEAERIVKKEFKLKKIAVISGIGVRQYWRELGYKLKETYMVKNLN